VLKAVGLAKAVRVATVDSRIVEHQAA
jgi:hypothetical protein